MLIALRVIGRDSFVTLDVQNISNEFTIHDARLALYYIIGICMVATIVSVLLVFAIDLAILGFVIEF